MPTEDPDKKFDGTVTEVETNLGLHDDIQAYLQLERDGNWYAYCSVVSHAAPPPPEGRKTQNKNGKTHCRFRSRGSV